MLVGELNLGLTCIQNITEVRADKNVQGESRIRREEGLNQDAEN